MYCHTCGARLAKALSYCNHCGANLTALKVEDQAGTSGMVVETLLWVIVGTTITLLGMALGALVLMNNGQINERLGTTFVILTFVTLVVSEIVLVWRLLKLNRGAKEIPTATQLNNLSTRNQIRWPRAHFMSPSSPYRVSPSRPHAPWSLRLARASGDKAML